MYHHFPDFSTEYRLYRPENGFTCNLPTVHLSFRRTRHAGQKRKDTLRPVLLSGRNAPRSRRFHILIYFTALCCNIQPHKVLHKKWYSRFLMQQKMEKG
jgi:hypothetical protein